MKFLDETLQIIKKSNSFVILLNIKHIDLRLNLQSCDHVLFWGDTKLYENVRVRDLVTSIVKNEHTTFHHLQEIN